MEYFARPCFPIFNTRDVNDYLHATLCKMGKMGKNRSGSTPYANKRNRKHKNKPKRK